MNRYLITLNKSNELNTVHQFEISQTDSFVYLKIKLSDKIGGRAANFQIFSTNNQLKDNLLISQILVYDNLSYAVNNDNNGDIILRVKRNYHGIPKYFQFAKLAKISEMILEMRTLYNIPENLSLLKADGSIIDNNSTLEANGLDDDSKVKIWVGDSYHVKVTLQDPLIEVGDQVIGQFDYSVTEKVENLKAYIQSMNYRQFHNLQLFTDTAVLDNSKQLLNYPLAKECTIYCVDMKKRPDVRINSNDGTRGKYAKKYTGTLNFPTGEISCPIVAYAYDYSETNINKMKRLKYEIVTRLILPHGDESPFVKLITMYIEEKKLFIVTKDMPGGSLKDHLPSEEKIIVKYCRQILDGLKSMHDRRIIHRNINCRSVLIDGKGNAKLSNFHFSKFLYNWPADAILDGVKGSKVDDDAGCVAPEVLLGEPYGFKADVWSFGATLIEMVTRRQPYPNVDRRTAITIIERDRTIVYDQTCHPNTIFHGVIASCIKPKQKERPIVSDLIALFPN